MHTLSTNAMTEITHIERLDDADRPFPRGEEDDIFWGYRVKVGLDEPYSQRRVWVRNPRFSDNTQGAEVWYDDLRDDKCYLIDIDDAEEEGWCEDLHEALLEDLHARWEQP